MQWRQAQDVKLVRQASQEHFNQEKEQVTIKKRPQPIQKVSLNRKKNVK